MWWHLVGSHSALQPPSNSLWIIFAFSTGLINVQITAWSFKTPFWYPQRRAFLAFSKNAVEVEGAPQQVVEQGAFKLEKTPNNFHGTLWMLSLYMISKKWLSQFIQEKSPQWVLNAKSLPLAQEAPRREDAALGGGWIRCGCVQPSLRSPVVCQYDCGGKNFSWF